MARKVSPFIDDGTGNVIFDSTWVRKTFMLSTNMTDRKFYNLTRCTSATFKFTDTRLGGNWAINQPAAYCRYADPRVSGINVENQGGSAPRGMGEYWSDQIDDNMQLIHMRFGVPEYRGMISFFSGFNDIGAGVLARTGRVPLTFYAGQIVGTIVGLRLLPFVLIGSLFKFLMGRAGSKYYYLRPTMHTYWNRVNFIANNMAVAMGLAVKIPTSQKELEAELEDPMSLDQTASIVQMAHSAAPRIFRKDGGVDVYNIATRTQTLANQRRALMVDRLSTPTSHEAFVQATNKLFYEEQVRMTQNKDFESMLKLHAQSPNGNPDAANTFAKDNFSNTLQNSIDSGLGGTGGALAGGTTTADVGNQQAGTILNPDGTVQTTTPAVQAEGAAADESYVPMWDYYVKGQEGTLVKKEGWIRNLITSFKSNFDAGYEYVGFRVDATGPISASFSNQVGEPDISSKLNGLSSSMASLRFSFSNGATGIPGVDQIVSGITDFTKGLVSGIDMAGLISLAGSSFVDIPDHWQNSTSELPTESYNIALRSPYGNKLSRFCNLFVPLACLLAGALPISHGRQSWGSPFICEIISVGRRFDRLAIIDSLNVTHGVGTLGFNRRNEALGIDVSMNVRPLSRTMHTPIDTGFTWTSPLKGVFDDDNQFNDYMSALCATSMAELTIPTRRLMRNVNLRLMQFDSFWSTGNFSMAVMDSQPARFVRAVAGIVPGLAPANTRAVS